jgi:hypothetical protein
MIIKASLLKITVITFLLFSLRIEAKNVFFYKPQNVGNIKGRAFADTAAPLRLLNMSVFGATQNAVSQAINGWQVGDFSGVASPEPKDNYQRGISNTWIGSTSVQMTNSEMGGQLHTYSISPLGGSNYNYNLANLQVNYTWADFKKGRSGQVNILPWRHSTSRLKFQFKLKIPNVYMEGGAIGYVYASLLLQDENGKIFWLQPQIFDTRGTPSSEFLGWDGGTKSGYVNTFYDSKNATRYCSKDTRSYSSTDTTWRTWHLYSFSVNRTQLLNAVASMNQTFNSGLSNNVAGYRVVMFTVQDEIYWETGNGWLPMSIRDLNMYEQY